MATTTVSNHSRDNDEGWTHVPTKSRRRGVKPRPPPAVHHQQQSSPRVDNLRSLDDIAAEYHRIRNHWDSQPTATALRSLITANISRPPASISRAICLGIGTFDPPDGSWDAKRRTFLQLIAFLVMVEALEAKFDVKMKCIFQEPVFTESDKAFITSLGHRVVDDPEGFDLVTSETLLFGVHLYRPIYAKALGRCLPAVFVGTDLDVWDTVTLGESDDLMNGRIMEKTYAKMKCPQDSSSTAFNSTSIYWRSGDKALPPSGDDPKDVEAKPSKDPQDEEDIASKLESITLG